MAVSRPDAGNDQEFLALLVHRGFLDKAQALRVLARTDNDGFEPALAGETRWDASRIAYLRRTRAMSEPDIPGYVVERRLGAGGTSEVFAARCKADGRAVALKILRPALAADPLAVRRFLDEARLLQRLTHPAIVRGARVFKFMDTYVLEMERVSGRTLDEHLADGRTFDEDTALSLVMQVASALEYMRQQGVVHRDLKPGNLMIDGAGRVKIIDLGFAGRGLEGRADACSTLGTPAYLSPEQARGQDDLDCRSDIYSLGATLYHLVIGRLPFEGGDDSEILRKQVLEGLNGAALKGRSVSPSLHYFIQKMMAKEREVRYPTPAELTEDIEAHRSRQRRMQ
ncbi:MAG: serine/threonine protein kinase [Planctomycetota bacterium]|nr:MAG: serine/threonine protein kinase [Planctomycetota bacterium]